MSTGRNLPGKPASPNEPRRPAQEKSSGVGWSRSVRIVVSLLILWHLFGVFLGPFSITSDSPLARTIALSPSVAWYISPLYLHTGYGFFSPDPPGSSSIIRYKVTGKDGKVVEGQFPDLDNQWPRLRYHRYMMLAEQCKNPMRREPIELRAQTMLRVFARRLLREYDGVEAQVKYVFHDVLPIENVADDGTENSTTPKMKIDDERTFREVDVVTQTAVDLDSPITFPHLLPEFSSLQESVPPPRSGP